MDDALAARYAAGTVAETDAWSLEKHVEVCGRCAQRVSAAVRAGTAGPALASIREAVLATATPAAPPASAAPSPTRPTRLTRPTRPAGPAGPARPTRPARSVGGRFGRVVWAAGPALRGAWVVAVVLVAAGAVGLAYGAGFHGARPLLLALAPLLPLAGVAVSYGRHADPMYEISASTPSGGLRLLLIRTAAVLGVSLPLLTAAGAALPTTTATTATTTTTAAIATATTTHGAPGAAAWLLPGLALTLGALALGSYVGCRTAAAVVGSAWGLAVALPALTSPGRSAAVWLTGDLALPLAQYFDGPLAQGGWAVAAALCAGVLALRRTSFDRLEFS
ncbi:zf-HC2 domain-containing protein [Streptomyces flavidovirens]|uniref:zf-HC2 domain-containing protein n=1 Tax=Streptomyces flavidovirens TaxID=67298 RepID=UPI0036AADDB5